MPIPISSNSQLTDSLSDRVGRSRKIRPGDRLLIGLRHSDLSMQVVRAGIRNQFPLESEDRITQLLFERIELMRRMEER